MNNLKTQMLELMRGIASDARERQKAIQDIKKETAGALLTFDRERMAMSAALKATLSADRTSRSAEVLDIRSNAIQMSTEFREQHLRMGDSLRESLVESKLAVVGAVNSLRTEFFKERTAFAKIHRQMARTQRKALIKGRIDRSQLIADLMASFTKSHSLMAKTQHAELSQGRLARSHEVVELMRSFQLPHVSKPANAARAQPQVRLGYDNKPPVNSFNWSQAVQEKPSAGVENPMQSKSSLFVDQVAEVVGALKHPRATEVEHLDVRHAVHSKSGKSKKK